MYSLLTRFIPYYFFLFFPFHPSFNYYSILYFLPSLFVLLCLFIPPFLLRSFIPWLRVSFFSLFYYPFFLYLFLFSFILFGPNLFLLSFLRFLSFLLSFSQFSASLISTEDIILPVELFFLVIEHTSWFPVNRIEHLKFYMKNILEVVTI